MRSAYDKHPYVTVPGARCCEGWDQVAEGLRQAVAARGARRTVVSLECYPGVDEQEVLQELKARLHPVLVLAAAEALRPKAELDNLAAPYLGGGDPVFGFISNLEIGEFFQPGALAHLRAQSEKVAAGLVLVVGCGATLVHPGDLLVYADLARWEAQQRFRRHQIGNLGADNPGGSAAALYQRAFFVDWRVADRRKRELMGRWDFVLDTNNPRQPKLASAAAISEGLREAVRQPFRVVPFFDPAPWGGQWLKEVCDLERNAPNYGWCFDCVPEENSLVLGFGNARLELPAQDLVLAQAHALLGEEVHERFGAEFPIRFDFLDTMGGGNLSFQVHPLTAYIREHFGIPYTQDESYYLMDAGPDASVFLGLRDGVNSEAMAQALEQAQRGGAPFPAEKFANRWPAKKHDHFLIPAGTVHCSGANAMVLEISATPYIFTFKLWDWARLGLDGKPRPIHLQHGLANIQWNRTTDWVKRNLINRVEPLAAGDGWREERTGLHELEFIETRRHWFSQPVLHDTAGTVNVLNLVEGEEAVVESPEQAFAPFPVHYAETFIVSAAVGRYRIRPGRTGAPCATMKAFVRPVGR